MRIIKLSDQDEDMLKKKKGSVNNYFKNVLPNKKKGKFEITENKTVVLKKDLCKDEKLVFTYQAKLVYLGYADSGVIPNTEPKKVTYPSYFLVKRIYPAKDIRLEKFAKVLREKGLIDERKIHLVPA